MADCAVQQVIPLAQMDEFLQRTKLKGGGGTSHICVFDYIDQHKLTPRLFIGLTDLCSNFPTKKPPYPVLWVVPKVHDTPPWGKVIEV